MAEKAMTPVYLIHGEDGLKRETAVKRLVARFERMGDLEFNSTTLHGETDTGDDIIAACNTIPFMSEQRLVIVLDVDKLPKEDLSKLAYYCDNPCDTTVLALVGEKVAKNSVLYKGVARNFPKSFIDCTPKSRREMPALISSMARVYGMTISPQASEMLVSYVGSSTTRLDAELRKLSLSIEGRHAITEADIARLVARTTETKPWELCDALSSRDAAACERLLDRLKDQSPVGLLSNLENRVRELMIYQSLVDRNSVASAPSRLGKQEWQLRSYRQWARRFAPGELADALSSAADVEQRMKSGFDPDLELERWMLSVCDGTSGKRA